MDVQREVLASRIREAFAGNSRPPRDRIALHQCEECEELRSAFAEAEWNSMTDVLVESHPQSLVLLSPEAFHYFLPGYLLYALRHTDWRYDATEMTVYAVAPDMSADEEYWARLRDRLKQFTTEEGETVSDFLELLASDAEYRTYLPDLPGRCGRYARAWESRWDV